MENSKFLKIMLKKIVQNKKKRKLIIVTSFKKDGLNLCCIYRIIMMRLRPAGKENDVSPDLSIGKVHN
jgi:hypothetical protein